MAYKNKTPFHIFEGVFFYIFFIKKFEKGHSILFILTF